MINYLLDSSFLIDFLRQQLYTKLFLDEHVKDNVITSSICEVEILEGLIISKKFNSEKQKIDLLFSRLSTIQPFDSKQADIASMIRAELRFKGQKIDDFDTLIAAAAIATNSTLVTTNLKHFSRIPSLRMLNVSKSTSS